jgi:pimeloyl-ACP methyl ester carboxylesterase
LSSGRGLEVGSRLTGRLTDRPGDSSRMIQPLQLPARGLVFDVLATGPPTGEPVVLLHGFPQTSACWRPLLAILAAAGYRAVAPDQRGYSPKARPTTIEAYRLPELVADVLAIADRLGAETFHLVGHDWGGVVAWRLAGQQPERVATPTAVSTPHPRPLPGRCWPAPRGCGRPTSRCSASLGCPSCCWAPTGSGGCAGCWPRTGWGRLDRYLHPCPGATGRAVGGAGLVPGGHPVQPAGPSGERANNVCLGLG